MGGGDTTEIAVESASLTEMWTTWFGEATEPVSPDRRGDSARAARAAWRQWSETSFSPTTQPTIPASSSSLTTVTASPPVSIAHATVSTAPTPTHTT